MITSETILRDLKDHTLEKVLDHPAEKEKNHFEAYYLRPPEGGRMMSTLITFTPEGIVIMGDLCPDGSGVISCYGYGRKWFVGKLSGGEVIPSGP